MIFSPTDLVYASNYNTSLFSNALKQSSANSYNDVANNFSIEPPMNWIVLNNVPSEISKNALVVFSNNNKNNLATFAIFHRTISSDIINAINKYSDNDVLYSISKELSVNETDSKTIVLKGAIDRYEDGIRIAMITTTIYKTDNSTSGSESIIYFLNTGNQYTLVLTSNPDAFEENSKLFETSANSFTVNQTSLKNEYPSIPMWVKNNAKFWYEGAIDNNEFAKGIQYFIDNGIIVIHQGQSGPHKLSNIPSWLKNNAKFWSDEEISDNEFIDGLQYLIDQRIVDF